jgi:hypothetical protein
MKWNWFSRPVPRRRRGPPKKRRSHSAVLGVRRLERRRVLDASITSLTAMAPVTQINDTLTFHEADQLKMTATANGLGTLFFDWSLKEFDAAHPNGVEIDSLHQTAISGEPVLADFTMFADNPLSGHTLQLQLQVSDAEQTVDIEIRTLNVLNVPPTLDLSGASSIPALKDYALTIGQVTDPGADTVSQYLVHWGDGESSPFTAAELDSLGRIVHHTYAVGPASRTISIDLVDEDGTYENVDSLPLQVLAPEATITDFQQPPTIFEGQTVFAKATAEGFGTLFFDWSLKEIDPNDPLNPVEIDSLHQTSTSGQEVTADFTIADDNQFNGHFYRLDLQVSDGNQTIDSDSKFLTVLNVAPDLDLTGAASVLVGTDYALTIGPVTDPGTDTVSQYIVHWGDGQTSPFTAAEVDGMSRVVHHTYTTGPTTRTISIDLVDEDGAWVGVDTHLVNVLVPVAKITDFQSPAVINEGDTLEAKATGDGFGTLFFDWSLREFDPLHPGGVEIDSLHQTAVAGQERTATFQLPDDNDANGHTYAVVLTLSDSAQTEDKKENPLTVHNVDPTLIGTNSLSVQEGNLFSLAALGVQIRDPGYDHPFDQQSILESFEVVRIDWGDGSVDDNTDADLTDLVSVTGRLSPVGGPTTASITHQQYKYADDGDYLVTVTVKDDDGGFVERTFTIHVNNADPVLALTTRIIEQNEGTLVELPDLGSFTDPGFDNPNNPNVSGGSTETFHYTIDWGDGSTPQTMQMPATTADSALNKASSGTLVHSHFYADDDADDKYTITVSLFDDDGGQDQKSFDITIHNVSPSLLPVSATDLGTSGKTTLQLTFSDPGTDQFQVLVDWGDKLNLPPEQRFVVETAHAGPTPASLTLPHTYTGPPDPLHPTADITINVKILDDDAGLSNLESDTITNPGFNSNGVAIDTTADVPRLGFAASQAAGDFLPAQVPTTQTLQTALIRLSGGETVVATDRYLVLCVIPPIGERKCFRIKDEAIYDLRGLFATLPDNRYQVFVVRTENNSQRLVIEVDVRRGHLVDPSDISEGTRDRPPTSEAAVGGGNNALPLEQNPMLQRIFDAGQPAGGAGGGPAGVDPQSIREAPRSAGLLEPTSADVELAAPSDSDSNAAGCACAGLAAAGAVVWSKRLDLALAEADERCWQRLRRAGRMGRLFSRIKG